MTITTYTRAQLIDALSYEYTLICHDDFDPDVDMSSSDHRSNLDSLSYDELVSEACTDGIYTLDEFIANHS